MSYTIRREAIAFRSISVMMSPEMKKALERAFGFGAAVGTTLSQRPIAPQPRALKSVRQPSGCILAAVRLKCNQRVAHEYGPNRKIHRPAGAAREGVAGNHERGGIRRVVRRQVHR